ncbi:acyl-CoA dehydrogenase family protein [Dactylosporangium sp. NPDC051484]|uniref:acyl-CoA dehydrogenase family protein n=1 Tax=Dactylosporangium sp. NPDC051484 TaxID=3154942 RepID=UPI00345074B5
MTAFTKFLDTELAPLVRRMADRPRHPDGADDETGNRQIRAMVWQGLAEIGLPTRQQDLVELAELLGSVLYQGPLLDTVSAGDLLARAGLDGLIRKGEAVALAIRAHGAASPAELAPVVTEHGLLSTRRYFVGFAAEVEHLVVVGDRLALVPRDHPTVTLRRYEETGRGELFDVRFTGTPVTAWIGDGEQWRPALATARIRQAAYLVGLSQGALDLAVRYATARRQFGQPIGRFQALAFRLAELGIRIDAARLLTRDAAREAERGLDARLVAAQSLATAAELARTVTTAAMQIHGAAGMTSGNDAQVFYRRAAIEALWLGSPTQLRAEAAPLLLERVSDR